MPTRGVTGPPLTPPSFPAPRIFARNPHPSCRSTLYNGLGTKAGLIVSIPSAGATTFTHATPTGTVFDSDANLEL